MERGLQPWWWRKTVEKDVVGPSTMVVESDSVGPSPIWLQRLGATRMRYAQSSRPDGQLSQHL